MNKADADMYGRRYGLVTALGFVLNFQLMLGQALRTVAPSEPCLLCPTIVVKGKLAKWLEISDCKAISGMTCRIWFKRGATLPSRIFMQEVDGQSRPVGQKRALIYPNLKTEEKGWATFQVSRANAVVLTGEWKGPWKSAY